MNEAQVGAAMGRPGEQAGNRDMQDRGCVGRRPCALGVRRIRGPAGRRRGGAPAPERGLDARPGLLGGESKSAGFGVISA